MSPIKTRWLVMVLLFFAVCTAHGKAGRCAVCDRSLPSQYLVFEGRDCCSSACLDTLRPHCSVCNATISGEYMTSGHTVYCSDKCFESTLPKCELCSKPIRERYIITTHTYCKQCQETRPRCFSCGLPAAHPTRLQDGRAICAPCMRWAVKDEHSAQLHYERALRHLQAWTSLELQTVPKLALVDCSRMNDMSDELRKSDSPVSLRGLYSRQVSTTTIKGWWSRTQTTRDVEEHIYLVDHLHDSVFRAAAIHEFMHDLIQEYYPRLKEAPLWVEEGICQQAAAEYCRRRYYKDILYGIENCIDPDYGNGYRYIRQQVGTGGWAALQRWMENVDITMLPEKAPHIPADS